MKEQILQVIKTALTKDYFLDLKVSLAVNYEKVFGEDYFNPILLKDVDISDIDKTLSDIGDIEGYNLSFEGNRGVNGVDYDKDWKTNIFTFWSGVDEGGKEIDTSKYGKFEWRTLGSRESFENGNGIRSKLWRPDFDSDEREALIDGNYFEYDKVGETMDLLNELDIILDRHQVEKVEIYNKLKLEL